MSVFNNDLSFSVAGNPLEISSLRLFGEALLHIELNTVYGKKELVCGNGDAILNHIMLKNSANELQRFSVNSCYAMNDSGCVAAELSVDGTVFCWEFCLNELEAEIQPLDGSSAVTLSLSPLPSVE